MVGITTIAVAFLVMLVIMLGASCALASPRLTFEGALADAEGGASLAGCDDGTVEAMRVYGYSLGMAFQIVDDVLDVVATDEQLGKPAGLDLREGAYNLPTMRALAAEEGDELRSILGSPIDGDDWKRARFLVASSRGIDEAIGVANNFVTAAEADLGGFGDRHAAVALAGAARHLVAGVESVRNANR